MGEPVPPSPLINRFRLTMHGSAEELGTGLVNKIKKQLGLN